MCGGGVVISLFGLGFWILLGVGERLWLFVEELL